MSIIGLIDGMGVSQETLIGLLMYLGTAVGLLIIVKSRAYRPASICGPQRLPPDEPLGSFVFIMIGGMSLWMFVPVLILKFSHRGVRAEDVKPTAGETVVLSIVAGAVPLMFMLLGTATRRRRGLETLGFTGGHVKDAVLPALAGSAFIIPLIGWVAILADWLMKKYHIEHPMKHDLLKIMDEAPGVLRQVLIAFSAVVIAPLFEEFLFRGHLQTLLSRVTQLPWVAVVVTSMVFALAHPWFTWIPIFVLSICLGYLYERTGNLWVSVLVHAMFNGFSIVLSLWSH
jgi:membrane protease YdiL (CAAX protease family)